MQPERTDSARAASAAAPIPLPSWPHFDSDEIDAVARVLGSGKINYWTGTECREFEKEYAAQTGSQHAIALANGTVSLELALAVLGIGDGDEVVTTPRTFIASASCAVVRGARPVFADVDLDSQNITAQTIEPVLSPRTKAIVLVHLGGWPCEMDEILSLARSRRVAVIEDCAQANGALYKGRPVGGLGDFGSFSFCQDKIITTGGEGGMLVTDDEDAWRRAWEYKDHGKSYDAVYRRQHNVGFRWLHESFGTNWRMTEMQGAIGRLQLRKLANWSALRERNAVILRERLQECPLLRVPLPPAHVRHAWYRFYAFVRADRLRSGWDRDRLVEAIKAEGVPCFSGSCSEIYREQAFVRANLQPAAPLPNAHRLGEDSVALLVHPTLDPSHMNVAADAVLKAAAAATR